MKRLLILLLFFSAAFAGKAQYSEYQAPDSTIHNRSEIRRFLLTQEKGTPVRKLARQSRTSNTVGVTLLSIGSVFAAAGIAGIAMSDRPVEQSMMFPWAVGAVGFGAINIGLGISQLNRADRKLEQAQKLYYGL